MNRKKKKKMTRRWRWDDGVRK